MILSVILVATLLAGVGSVWLAAALAYALLSRFTQYLLSFAAGALLATAFMRLLPEAFEQSLQTGVSAHHLFAMLLLGLIFFFLLDKAELWHHGHEHRHDAHAHGTHTDDALTGDTHGHDAHSHQHSHAHAHSGGWAVLLGDSVHAFGDGILIASAFMADMRLGIVASLAVLAHEVPHHMGDLAVLRQGSSSRQAAIVKVSMAGAITALGGAVGYVLVDALLQWLPYFLVVASSSFVYVALADLIPQLQKRLSASATSMQVLWLLAGIGLVTLARQLMHVH